MFEINQIHKTQINRTSGRTECRKADIFLMKFDEFKFSRHGRGTEGWGRKGGAVGGQLPSQQIKTFPTGKRTAKCEIRIPGLQSTAEMRNWRVDWIKKQKKN